MDPREQLRAFLEQRRELGETEFVLDTMGVEEALRVLGAGAARGARGREPAAGAATPTSAGTWRAALRALDAGPEKARAERQGSEAADAPRASRSADETAASKARHAEAPGQARGAPPQSQDAPAPPDMRNLSVPGRIVSPPVQPTAPRPDAPVRDDFPPAPQVPLESIPTGLVVGSAAHELFGGPASPWNSLDDIAHAVSTCSLCTLARTAKNPVPGQGNPNADFVCVGEAPGATEDEQGLAFVGQAGQLLTKILAAIDLTRDDVFICNVLKHRPPGNRNPNPDEVTACSPYLVRQIELLRPKVILGLGTFAAQTLLQTREPIAKLRGKIHRYYGVPLVVTYHPAALLRNPSWKRPTWEDVQLARRLLDRAIPGA